MSKLIPHLQKVIDDADGNVSPEWCDQAEDALTKAVAELDRYQKILDNRPAINAALPESYIEWSQSIYVMEFSGAALIP